jgi:Protease subunit of ATP-dependent Clp proteases
MVEEVTKQGKSNMDIDSYLMKKQNSIYLIGEITDEMAMDTIKKIQYLSEKSDDDIVIIINSVGGSVTAGLAIYDVMQSCSNNITTIGIGCVASMGAFLLSAGTQGYRYAYPHCEIMIHQVLGNIQGNMIDVDIAYQRMKEQNNVVLSLLAKHCKSTLKNIQKYTERDCFLTANQAMQLGLIDSIV